LARGTFALGVIGSAKTVAREKKTYIFDDSSRYVNAEARFSKAFLFLYIFDIALQVLRHQAHRQQARGGKLGALRHIIYL